MSFFGKVLLALVAVALSSAVAVSDPKERVKLAIVKIIVETEQHATEEGAGFIVAAMSGKVYVATAYHVVENASKVRILFRDFPTDSFYAQVFEKIDEAKDLAIVVIPKAPPLVGDIPRLRAGKTDKLEVPEEVYAIGHPADNDWELSVGNVRDVADPLYVRFSGDAVDPGNSGGALLDAQNRVIGMVTKKDPRRGFALKTEVIASILEGWDISVWFDYGDRWYKSIWVIGGSIGAAAAGIVWWLWPDDGSAPEPGDLPGPPGLPDT